AWFGATATSGIQEAANTCSQGSTLICRIQLPASRNISLTTGITIPANSRVSIHGAGIGHTVLQTVGTTGNWITYNASGNGDFLDIGDFSIGDSTSTYHTSGTMIVINAGHTYGTIQNIQIAN